jgi:uncharacterized protein YeaO (DUF488 family)
LRRWFAPDPHPFGESTARCRAEPAEPGRAAILAGLRDIRRYSTLAPLTAVKAVPISHAAVLAEVVPEHA